MFDFQLIEPLVDIFCGVWQRLGGRFLTRITLQSEGMGLVTPIQTNEGGVLGLGGVVRGREGHGFMRRMIAMRGADRMVAVEVTSAATELLTISVVE